MRRDLSADGVSCIDRSWAKGYKIVSLAVSLQRSKFQLLNDSIWGIKWGNKSFLLICNPN